MQAWMCGGWLVSAGNSSRSAGYACLVFREGAGPQETRKNIENNAFNVLWAGSFSLVCILFYFFLLNKYKAKKCTAFSVLISQQHSVLQTVINEENHRLNISKFALGT